jgi:WhiB family redox-sensing transcriptional regulator
VALSLSVEPFSIEHDDWRDNAACRDTNPDLFFPVGTTGPAIEQIDQAKAVCRQCDAQVACLEFALVTNQDSGVWGGTSEEERRKLRKAWLARQRTGSAVLATRDSKAS